MKRTIFEAEHDEFRSSLAALLAKTIPEEAARHRDEGSIDRSLWEVLGDHGFLGFMVPEHLGGADTTDFRFNAILGEELARYGVAYASSFGINTDVVAPYLLELTTDEQRARWLPPFASGRLVTAIGMTEPGAGSDLASIRTRAVRGPSGWTLDGAKTFITNGMSADLIVTAAVTGPGQGKQGISLFLVPGDARGVERGRKLDKIGQPEADTAELYFEDVRLDDDALLGEEGCAWTYMTDRLPQERLSVAVVGVAHARWMLDETIAYVTTRRAFGQAISRFQNTKFVLADLHARIESTQTHVDACIAAAVTGDLEPVDAAVAKLLATELQGDVADQAVQLHGGYGFIRETAVARAWLDARVTRIYAGTSEIMREVIGRSLAR